MSGKKAPLCGQLVNMAINESKHVKDAGETADF